VDAGSLWQLKLVDHFTDALEHLIRPEVLGANLDGGGSRGPRQSRTDSNTAIPSRRRQSPAVCGACRVLSSLLFEPAAACL
jgi:hypothetical protein